VAQAGCLWQDVDAEAQAFGLAVTGGLVSTTGIAGFTLGGEIGWLVRRCGLTCDNLIGADIVTADGQYLHTSEDEHPDLFWALRGGGGNFGVVTSFEFQAHEVGPTVFAGIVFYRGEDALRVLHGFGEAAANAPDELGPIRTSVIPAGHLRPAHSGEGPLRPHQPVPTQPEHPAVGRSGIGNLISARRGW
jgi:FAD/FMN-containing dehydrogenase